MAFIDVETPDGIASFEISGEEPTDQEMEAIRSTIYGSEEDLSFPDLRSIPEPAQRAIESPEQEIAPDFTPTVDGQVTSASDRYGFGEADTAAEEEQFLTNTYGPGSFGKDNQGRYYLNLDNISPEIKEAKGLPESGTMWFNKPGGGFLGLFDMPDVVEFAGKYRGELIGGTAAALATTGVGLIPASIFIGLGAGAGKITETR
jgi:hypothetical protein